MSKLQEYKKHLEERLEKANDQAEIDSITNELAMIEEAIADEQKLLKDYKALSRAKKSKPSKTVEEEDDDDIDDDDDDEGEKPLEFEDALAKILKERKERGN